MDTEQVVTTRPHWGNTDAGRIIAAGIWVVALAIAVWLVCTAAALLIALVRM